MNLRESFKKEFKMTATPNKEEDVPKAFLLVKYYEQEYLDPIADWFINKFKGMLDKRSADFTDHICRFNDGEQKCECYGQALQDLKNELE